VQFGMPFNVSNPVLYYNRKMFEEAGLDPDVPPRTLEELRQFSQQIVDSGAASFGLAIDSGTDSGGGWFIEQWFANAGELYADNGNGRLAPATRVLYDEARGVELLTYVQQLISDGLVAYVGDNAAGSDTFLKLADQTSPAAMTIGTSAGLGTVIAVLGGGLVQGLTPEDIGVGPMPGPGPVPTALVGGAALYIVRDHGDEKSAAAWDFITYAVSPEAQSQFVTDTGYVPVRADALEVEPALTKFTTDPRFRVAYDQLIGSPDDPALQGPILGPQREVRSVTARAVAEIFNGGDVQTALSAAAEQADLLIADYAARN
jgi:sn-glycerol 3-phosphate transport system substrate-binding protein